MGFRGHKITIMGLGRHGGGVAAARFCAQAGAIVTVTDLADEMALAESLAALVDVPIAKFTLGEHRDEDFSSADIVVVNPAVKPEDRHIEIARQAGATITSETELFLNACPATVVGVTGTVGKSTTAAMLAAMLQAAERRAWLGGNIGQSLLPDLPRMRAEDLVVLEMSSFQLHWLSDSARWPREAVVTNCSPNHLDWHGTWEHYVAAKQRLLSHLPTDGFAVLNHHDAEVGCWRSACRGQVLYPDLLKTLPPLRVPGEHNRINAASAATMAKQLGVDDETIARALADFSGLPHRLEFVAEIAGRRFYNDSKSTTPAATVAAMNTMDRPTWLLLGGADKNTDLAELVEIAMQRAKGVAMFGSVAGKLDELFRRHVKQADNKQAGKAFSCFCSESLAEALRWSWQQSSEGEAILLSPACASTDQFRDFTQRGKEFVRLVRAIENN
jgi:UDP-N-acetylmuramoylalanine--D-glutamate ligase